MIPSSFDRAFAFVIGEEGGYVNDPTDPGGETKFGISKRAYPQTDIKALTVDDAKTIYLRDYWHPLSLDALPYAEAVAIFDCAVNQGAGEARILMVKSRHGPEFLVDFLAERAVHYAASRNVAVYGRGWFRRLFEVQSEALKAPA